MVKYCHEGEKKDKEGVVSGVRSFYLKRPWVRAAGISAGRAFHGVDAMT